MIRYIAIFLLLVPSLAFAVEGDLATGNWIKEDPWYTMTVCATQAELDANPPYTCQENFMYGSTQNIEYLDKDILVDSGGCADLQVQVASGPCTWEEGLVEPPADDYTGPLTFSHYFDLLHGFAGILCGFAFVNLWLSKL